MVKFFGMKKRVRYEIRGQIERSCYFRVGKALLRVEFTGGSINSAGMTPAHYVTDNPVYQQAIENSEQFRSGEIVIGVSEDVAEETMASGCADSADGASAVFTDVTNVQQARSVIMGEPYNVPLSELQNKAAVRAKADELGLSFPNWL